MFEYKRSDIILACETAIKQIETFYQANFINNRGKTIDTGEYYTEIICEYICDHIALFKDTIPNITRKSPYKVNSHTGIYSKNSNREEEITAMKLFTQSKNGYVDRYIGKIIDYQTPLKSQASDIAGKVDLLSYDGNCLRILELKKKDSKETMLRCVIEGYTYLKTVNIKKLLADFELPENTIVTANPLVFKDGAQYKEMLEDRPHLKCLMTLLDSRPFYLKYENNLYSVEI